jgi:hypothetical protein
MLMCENIFAHKVSVFAYFNLSPTKLANPAPFDPE